MSDCSRPDNTRSLAQWLTTIETLHPKTIDLGLDRVKQVAQRLGIGPKLNAPVITVTGTNGKGSTIASLHQLYHAAGYQVACYTSPHLLDFKERMQVGNRLITDAELIACFEKIEAARLNIELTFFEFTTLAFLLWTLQLELDLILLEVGLGGRLDAVNIIDADIAVITCVALDHQDYLGDDREAIGREKAGIMRENKPIFYGEPHPPNSVIAHAQHCAADWHGWDEQFSIELQSSCWHFSSNNVNLLDLPNTAIAIPSVALALAVIGYLQSQLPISNELIRQQLPKLKLSGRMQTLKHNPTVLVDVGHNPAASQWLSQKLASMHFDRCYGVIGMCADKDIAGTLAPLRPLVHQWLAAPIKTPRSLSQAQWESYLPQAKPFDSIAKALKHALCCAAKNDIILVLGSFYTVAESIEVLGLSSHADTIALSSDPTVTVL